MAYLWQQAQGNELFSLPHEGLVSCALFSPDAQTLATASYDGLLQSILHASTAYGQCEKGRISARDSVQSDRRSGTVVTRYAALIASPAKSRGLLHTATYRLSSPMYQ